VTNCAPAAGRAGTRHRPGSGKGVENLKSAHVDHVVVVPTSVWTSVRRRRWVVVEAVVGRGVDDWSSKLSLIEL